MMNADNQLLESYARQGSERAFRELVERHVNLVYSAALRESAGNAPQAEDITQAVFTELARSAAKLLRHPSLSGWLYTCVRHMTANVRRAENRRQRREQEAFTMNEMLSAEPADKLWQQVRPVLDDVMHELNEQDRAAVVMRFFEGRSLKEVGQALNLSENAARMRVERSLEKLHGLLSRRGVKSTASTLAAVLVAGAVLSAPPSLAATVATGALTTAAVSASAWFGLSKLMSLPKIKIAVAATLLGLAAAVIITHHRQAIQPRVESTTQTPASPATDPGSEMIQAAAKSAASVVAPVSINSTNLPAMPLQIVDAGTGAPLANTKILLAYLRNDGRGKDVRAVTGATGRLQWRLCTHHFTCSTFSLPPTGMFPKSPRWAPPAPCRQATR
jgi:RNA polymerase sigma factor (sigma-70 family)